jgi:hypothetical protein
MDFYVIPPSSALQLMEQGDRYFCLSQLYLKDENYRAYFKQKVAEGAWVTLDNGAGDHETVTREQVLEIARDLQPSELIPLDILFNSKETIDNLEWTIEQMKNDMFLKHIEILACPQGESLSEWLDTYRYMLNNPSVDTIGMSKLAIPYAMSKVKGGDVNIARDRNAMYTILKHNELLGKPLHFLGAGEPWEFERYRGDPLVRSTDSCFSIWGGMNSQRFDNPDYERIPTPKDYFDRIIDPILMPHIISNIEHMRRVTK